MSLFRCESCGTDAPLSKPCPICEPLVSRALNGDYDLAPVYMPLPAEQTRALLSRLEAMRVELAAMLEQIAQRNREIQRFQDEVKSQAVAWVNCDTDRERLRVENCQLREAIGIRAARES